jgi:hypothetical protein
MGYQNWVNQLNAGPPWQNNSGTALATATTATLTPQPDCFTNQPFQQGQNFRITAWGILTTTTTSSGITVFLASKTSASSFVTLCTASSLTTGTTALTGIQWRCEATIAIGSVAASGTTVLSTALMTYGVVVASTPTLPPSPQTLTASATGLNMYMPASGGQSGAAVDTTQAQAFVIRATSTVAGPSIQCTSFILEQLS